MAKRELRLMIRFRLLVPLALFLLNASASAQFVKRVDVPSLGFSFDIPAGWTGMEQQGAWGLVKEDVAGTVIISTHEHKTLEGLEKDMTALPTDDPANSIQQVGPVRHPYPNAIELDFKGTMEWQPVWIGTVGMISNAGGPGLSIVALGQGTEPNLPLLEAAMSVIESVRFTQPVAPPVVEQWRAHLTGTRLTYISSYSSPSTMAGGLGGGMSTQITLDLCPGGRFTRKAGSDLTLGSADASAASVSGSQGTGSWDVLTDGPEGARLELRANDGSISSYTLEDRNGGTFLQGERWFRTTGGDGENAPRCDQ